MDDWGCLVCNGGRTMFLIGVNAQCSYRCPVCARCFGSGPLRQSFQFIYLNKWIGLNLLAWGSPALTFPFPPFPQRICSLFIQLEAHSPHEVQAPPPASRPAVDLVMGAQGSGAESCLCALAGFVPCTGQHRVSQLQSGDVTRPSSRWHAGMDL